MELSQSIPEQVVLYRVIPHWCYDGVTDKVQSTAFRPLPKDCKRLSVSDNRLSTPQEAYERFHQDPEHEAPSGVQGIMVSECTEEQLEVVPDAKPDDRSHALIDFCRFGTSRIRKISERLRDKAEKHNWYYRPAEIAIVGDEPSDL